MNSFNEIKEALFSKNNNKIIFLNSGPGFGDFVHKCLFLCANIKLKNKKVKIYFYQLNVRYENTLFDFFKDIVEFIELDKINNHHFDLIINETKIDKLNSHSHIKLSETQIMDYKDMFNSLDQNKIVNLNYSSLYFNSFIYSGLRYLTEDFREIFFDYISNKIKINDKYNDSIIFHIGSISRKDGDYNDKIFQSHIIKLVNTFTNKKFILLGLDSDIKNDNFKTILKKDNVNNLISKTDNVSELMKILFNSKLFIGKR